MSQLDLAIGHGLIGTEEQRAFLDRWSNEPDPALEPKFLEGDGREILPQLPSDSCALAYTSPPYPRPRKPEDLGRYRRFIGDDGSLLPGANDIPRIHTASRKLSQQRYRGEEFQEENRRRKREQTALAHRHAPRARREAALAGRHADLLEAGRSPHASKKLSREGFAHGKPNQKGETGLSVQLTPAEWWPWFEPFAKELLRVLKPRRSLLLNVGGVVEESWSHSTYDWDLPSQMKSIGWKFIRPIYWRKPNGPPTTAEGSMTNIVEHLFWFAKGTDPDHGPEWYPWELHETKNGAQTKRPIVRNVIEFPVGQTRWPVRCPVCSAVSKKPGNRRDVWLCRHCGEETARGEWEEWAHFACFPFAMAEWMVRGFSAPGELVLDPFMGSGTSAIAACKHGRRWVGIELNPEGELDCARARWELEFGKVTA